MNTSWELRMISFLCVNNLLYHQFLSGLSNAKTTTRITRALSNLCSPRAISHLFVINTAFYSTSQYIFWHHAYSAITHKLYRLCSPAPTHESWSVWHVALSPSGNQQHLQHQAASSWNGHASDVRNWTLSRRSQESQLRRCQHAGWKSGFGKELINHLQISMVWAANATWAASKTFKDVSASASSVRGSSVTPTMLMVCSIHIP